jgi:DNA repair exonuclease SbcCD ATPase subunit
MRKMEFKKLKAQNFLCFGEKGIEIDFQQYESIVVISGKNNDIKDVEFNSSNGSGKSSIMDALLYGLFGKTLKNPKKIGVKDVVNNKTNKKMVIEIYLDDIKILRSRKPDGLKLWRSKEGVFNETTELTRGEIKQTQEMIESILGFNYEAFKSICVFTDSNTDSYLESNAVDRRIIVENLLGLEKYRNYNEKTKEIIKETKNEIMLAEKDDNSNKIIIDNMTSYLTQVIDKKEFWVKTTQQEIEILKNDKLILLKQIESLKAFDPQIEKYDNAQKQILEKNNQIDILNQKITKFNTTKDQIENKIEEGKNVLNDHATDLGNIKNNINLLTIKISENKNKIDKITKLENGVTCNHCLSIIDKNSYFHVEQECNTNLNSLVSNKNELENNQKDLLEKINDVKADLQKILDLKIKINTSLNDAKNNIQFLQNEIKNLNNIQKPETINLIDKIENKINANNITLMEKENAINEKSPFCEIIQSAEIKINEAKTIKDKSQIKLNDLVAKIPYLNFWLDAFGDKGVRKFVVDQILPLLNNSVQNMLSVLVDGNLSLKFDNEFNEEIQKATDDTPIIYDLLSNGQKRRINLAISQAFAHVRELNSGTTPNIIFLDEISINMDSQGNNAIYKLIRNIAKNKKVFITTHDQELLQLLANADQLKLKMENGISCIHNM